MVDGEIVMVDQLEGDNQSPGLEPLASTGPPNKVA